MMPINVEVNRSKEGAAPAPHETCPRKGSDTTIGSAFLSFSTARFHDPSPLQEVL